MEQPLYIGGRPGPPHHNAVVTDAQVWHLAKWLVWFDTLKKPTRVHEVLVEKHLLAVPKTVDIGGFEVLYAPCSTN